MTNDSFNPSDKMPPFMKGRQAKRKPSDQKASARKAAIQDRLAKMSGKKK